MDNEPGSEGDNVSESSHKTDETTPINLLSEFLMAVMAKQYEKALKLCEEILEYEPNNATAQAFHMLIEERLALKEEQDASSSESADDDTESSESSEDLTDGATGSSYSSSMDDLDVEEESEEEEIVTSTPNVKETPAFSSSGSDSSIAPGPSKETVDALRSRVVTVKKTDGDAY